MGIVKEDYKDTNFITSLRAIAILLVFLIHSGGGGLRSMGGILNFFVDMGKYGVQVFFVISGYTIFHQFFSENYRLGNFLKMRIIRISIPYYPVLLLLFIYINIGGKPFNDWSVLFNHGQISLLDLVVHLSYLSVFFKQYQNSIIGVEWTLGVEIFFYIFYGILIQYRLLKLNLSSFFLFGGFLISVSVLLEKTIKIFKLDEVTWYLTPVNYGYMFLVGGLAYYIRTNTIGSFFKQFDIKRGVLSDLVVTGIVFGFILFVVGSGFFRPGRFSTEIGFVLGTFLVLVFFHNEGKLSVFFNNKWSLFLGSISYSFYLLHFIVILLLPAVKQTGLDFFLKLGVSIVISFFWYLLFEKKIYTNIKQKLFRRSFRERS